MKQRKTIGICVTGYDIYNETAIIEGMIERCKENDTNTIVFFSSLRKPELDSVMHIPDEVRWGESKVFDLINYDYIDGLAVFGASFLDEKMLDKLVRDADEHGIPILDIDDMENNVCRRLMLTNQYAMKKVVDHLIEVHGTKDICFISGFRDNPQSEERLAAYKVSLDAHGIPYDDSKVYYGEFWKKAYDCTTEIISKGKLPDAIVCANDTMAMFCMDCLKEHGYRIPEDIIVTGFDGLEEGGDYDPSPTTVKRALLGAGRAAANALIDIINGGKEEGDINVEAILVKGASCGCVSKNTVGSGVYTKYINNLNDYREFSRYILNMYTEFSGINRSQELFKALYRGTQIFGINKMYVLISADIEHSKGGFNVENKTESYTICDRMVSMFMLGHEVPVGTEFPTSELIPDGFDPNEPCSYVIAPLYFKNRFLGYLAFDPPKKKLEGDMLSTWLITISNNVGSFYLNNELESLYLHDHLTNCFNRRGLVKNAENFIKQSMDKGKQIVVACADVDGLKKINDSYGHEDGDVAIVTCAEALNYAFPAGSICARTGGDEYLVLASVDIADECEAIRRRIDEYCEGFNLNSGKPYKVGCSCGFAVSSPNGTFDYEEARSAADKSMYEEKLRRKALRE